jgi:hypothetical protein
MAEWIKRGGAIPKSGTLARELVSPMYFIRNGKFMLESKDQIKERLGFSTDEADALALTFSLPEMPGIQQVPREILHAIRKNELLEYDPFDPRRM